MMTELYAFLLHLFEYYFIKNLCSSGPIHNVNVCICFVYHHNVSHFWMSKLGKCCKEFGWLHQNSTMFRGISRMSSCSCKIVPASAFFEKRVANTFPVDTGERPVRSLSGERNCKWCRTPIINIYPLDYLLHCLHVERSAPHLKGFLFMGHHLSCGVIGIFSCTHPDRESWVLGFLVLRPQIVLPWSSCREMDDSAHFRY